MSASATSVRLAASGQSFTAGFKIGCKISAWLTGRRFLPNARGRLGEAASSSFTGCERPRGSGDGDGRLSLLVNRTAVSNDLN